LSVVSEDQKFKHMKVYSSCSVLPSHPSDDTITDDRARTSVPTLRPRRRRQENHRKRSV